MNRQISEIPDRWTVIKITYENGDMINKVFASWYGGYLSAATWRLNSGIEMTEEDEHFYYFYGYSGSCYKCRKDSEGVAGIYNKGTLSHIVSTLEEAGIKVEPITYSHE